MRLRTADAVVGIAATCETRDSIALMPLEIETLAARNYCVKIDTLMTSMAMRRATIQKQETTIPRT